jgi:hypothetical protein
MSREVIMAIDPTLISPVSALLGALVGGVASLLGAVHTQRSHDRVERVASEISKREAVYADFVMSASNLLLNAYTRDELGLGGDEQHMVGLINRMRLFAPTEVIEGAEAVFRAIVESAGLTWTTRIEESCESWGSGGVFEMTPIA